MPDVKEVFEMTTQKARPEPGALERHHGRRHRSDMKRRTGGFAVAAAILTIAVVAAIAINRNGDTDGAPVEQPPLAPGYYLVSIADGEATPFPVEREGAYGYRYSGDGSMLTFVEPDDAGHDQIFVMDAAGEEVQQVTHNAFQATAPTWSPDGDQIAYVGLASDDSREIFIVDVGTGRSERLTDQAFEALEPAWAPHGATIAFLLRQSGDHYLIRSVDAQTRHVRPLLDALSYLPNWAPDGKQIVFVSASGDEDRISLANADGTGRRQITEVWSDWPLWSPDGSTIAYNVWSNDGGTVAVWLYDVATGGHRLLRNGVGTEFWKDDGTLLVSTVEGS